LVTFVSYVGAVLAVVVYESRLQRVYRAKKEAIERIKNLPISMAVAGAKTFKVERDYQAYADVLYKRQREILKILPFFRRARSQRFAERCG
jgi:Na+-transporting NADH:ubiquinone oxidoreductase subunit NqrE